MRSSPFSVALLLALLAFAAFASSSSSSTGGAAPWQDPSLGGTNYAVESLYDELPPNTFDASGRLPVVERILPASQDPRDPTSNLVVAIRCRRGQIVAATSLPTSPYLPDDDSNNRTGSNSESKVEGAHPQPLRIIYDDDDIYFSSSPFCALAKPSLSSMSSFGVGNGGAAVLFGVSAGNAVDSQQVREIMTEIAEASREAEEETTVMLGRVVARRLADQCYQVRTQHAGKGRLLASAAVIMCYADGDEDNGDGASELWRVDPTGDFYRCRVAVSGRAAPIAETRLHRILENEIRRKRQSGDDAAAAEASTRRTVPIRPSTIRKFVSELSADEALGLASRAVLSTLESVQERQRRRGDLGNRAFALSTAVRIRGLRIGGVKNGIRWYGEDELLLLAGKYDDAVP